MHPYYHSSFSIVFPEAILTENVTYSQGENATLQCTSMGGPNNTYQWLHNETVIEGETSENLTRPFVIVTTGGVYTCKVSNLAGNHNASTFLFVYPYIVSDPLSVYVSTGSAVVLTCGAEAFPNPEYLWVRPDGRNISGENFGRNLSISIIEYGDEGEYYCNASGMGETAMSESAIITGTCMVVTSAIISR